MKYKLLKDTPTIKAGTIFEKVVRGVDGIKGSAVVVPIGANTDFQWTIKDIDNFDEWFEKIEEPLDSIHWEPEDGEEYFYISGYGTVYSETWHGAPTDYYRRALGFIYPTEEECEKARERELTEVRLRRTSTFEPDFENCEGGWIVGYDYEDESLTTIPISDVDYGGPVRYATSEDARKSIKENREDWLIYFGVKE